MNKVVGLTLADFKIYYKTTQPWLVWLGRLSVGLRNKASPVDSQSGHMPGLQVRSPVGGAQEANTH